MRGAGPPPHHAPPPPVRILQGARGAQKTWWDVPATSTSLVIYFGGDSVDDPAAHPDVHRLQAPGEVARLLRRKFGPDAALILVAPSRTEAGFACYDHFCAQLTRTGEPLGYKARVGAAEAEAEAGGGGGGGGGGDDALAAGLPALSQLASLLAAGGWPGGAAPTWPPTHLVGFSKGGVVLNQALAEAAALAAAAGGVGAAPAAWAPSDRGLAGRVASLAASIASLTYVDAGLNGRGAYECPPDAAALGRARGAGLAVALFGTPRQWGPGARPGQAAERDRMVAGLRAAGVGVTVTECGGSGGGGGGSKASLLAMHFRCLEGALAGGAGV